MVVVPINPESAFENRINAVPVYYNSRPPCIRPLGTLMSVNPCLPSKDLMVGALNQFHAPHLSVSAHVVYRRSLSYYVVVGVQRKLDVLLPAMKMECKVEM